MSFPELSEDEWIEDPAEAGEEVSLCTVDEDSDIAKEVQKSMDEVKAECEASDISLKLRI